MWLWSMVWALAALACCWQPSCAQQKLGGRLFISLNCGGVGSLQDPLVPDIAWQSDSTFISTGVVGQTKQLKSGVGAQFESVRYFPAGLSPTKNCYTLPVASSTTYLIRAGFSYGNYDGLQSSNISFQIAVNSTLWDTVSFSASDTAITYSEIITNPTTQTRISVCLIRTGSSTPFINTLELRELNSAGYTNLLKYPANLHLSSRVNFGERNALSPVRYPDDPYDRLWPTDADLYPTLGGTPIQAARNLTVEVQGSNTDLIPNAVMRTAITGPSLSFTRQVVPNSKMYTWLYFTELNGSLGPNERRVMVWSDNISGGHVDIVNLISDFSLTWSGYYDQNTGTTNEFTVTGKRDADSTLDVICNAAELYIVQDLVTGVHSADVAPLNVLKTNLNLTEWVGDPCLPIPWDELTCSTDSAKGAAVISLNLSGKNLKGSIPASAIASLASLTELTLSDNQFLGHIPDSLQNLSMLKMLNLSNNQLTGSLPDWLQFLQTLDVSNNQLDGTFPATLIKVLGPDNFRYSGNPLLQCVPVGQTACPQSTTTPAMSPSMSLESTNGTSIGPIVGAAVGSLVLILALTAGGILCYRRCCKASNKQPVSEGGAVPLLVGQHAEAETFSLNAIVVATKNFSQKLGEGGFGPVYYGVLPDEYQKKEVAVKVLSNSTRQGISEFSNEISLLSKVHHKNLVPLVGYYCDQSNLMLMYELQPGGDLQARLYGKKSEHPLNWSQRVKIVLGAAKGLDYLHNGCKPSIIHRDIKSSNILLDDQQEAKLTDFGISKLMEDGSDKEFFTTMVKGTPGYLDPEYEATGFLSQASDVYSFGIVIAEIVSGQPPFSSRGTQKRLHIVSRLEDAVKKGDIESVVDPAIKDDYSVDAAWRLALVAISCANAKSSSRPDMTWVLKELEQMVDTNNSITSFPKYPENITAR